MTDKQNRERRRYSRFEYRAQVLVEVERRKYPATIINFSEIGLKLISHHIFPPGKKLIIPISVRSNKVASLTGVVVWSRPMTKSLSGVPIPGSMGIELSAVPIEYLRVVADMRKFVLTHTKRMVPERFEVFHRVRFQWNGKTFSEFTENLNQGGVYIATEEPIEPETVLTIDLELPGHPGPLQFKGRVTHRLEEKIARETGRSPGIGIQFIDLNQDVQAYLQHYVCRLKIHRSSPSRILSSSVPSRGSFNDFLIPEIILNFSEQEVTGILKFKCKEIQKRVFFRRGSPVFVESSLPSESFGSYLTRRGVLRLQDLSKWLPLVENKGDLELTKRLAQEGLLDQERIMNSLVEYQEERLTNTFPWFEGTFEFLHTTDWPSSILILPLQIHRMIFSGITQWYDASLVSAWMGLTEDSILKRQGMPSNEIVLPQLGYQILSDLSSPKSMKDVSQDLSVTMKILLPSTYALIISKWVTLEFLDSSEIIRLSERQKKISREPQPTAMVHEWKSLVEEDFARLKNLDYFELLGISQSADEVEITHAYLTRTARYTKDSLILSQVEDKTLLQKISQILSWIRTAYETLLDPDLKFMYVKHRKPLEKTYTEENLLEVEKSILVAISELNEGRYSNATSVLSDLMKKSPGHPTAEGWYAWVFFKSDSPKNGTKALELLEKALQKDPSDPQLYYFKGEILAFQEKWKEAQEVLEHAIRLQSNFLEAQKSLNDVRGHVRITVVTSSNS